MTRENHTRKSLLFTTMVIAMVIFILPCAIADDHYAAQNGQPEEGPYTNWGIAASNIQDAVNSADTNDTVWVGAGRYTVPTNAVAWMGTNVVYINKYLTLRSSNSVPATTIIDGAGTNRGIAICYSSNTANGFVIDGFTISNCFATNMGGGVLFYQNTNSWSGVVLNCVVSDNTVVYVAGSKGGGLFSYSSWQNYGALIVSNCTIRNNRAFCGRGGAGVYEQSYGGGIYFRSDGQKTIINCLIEGNSATCGGGGHYDRGTSTVEKCVIRDNKCLTTGNLNDENTVQGGGWHTLAGGPHVLRNCLIYNNVSAGRGGGLVGHGGLTEIYNCTIVSNKAVYTGSGVALRSVSSGASMQIFNSIIYSNAVSGDLYLDGYTTSYVTNSCMGSTNSLMLGSGNITNPPVFVNWVGKNFRQANNSPCFNSGLNQSWMNGAKDLDGHSRIDRFFGRVDMGCYEYLPQGMMFKAR